MSSKVWYAPNMFESYGEEEINAVTECLKKGWLAGFGEYSKEFERQIAGHFGKKFGLFVNSGSSACLLALCSLDLPKGSHIITPACTFSTTVAPIVQLGHTPIFCDVELNKYVPSITQIIEKVTENTKAIMIPNLIGNRIDWSLLRKTICDMGRLDIILIEDSADTIVFTADSDISITSFYSSHVITACGSGGMVMFNNAAYLKRATMFRDWGRIGDNSEECSERFNHLVDGIPYDYKFLYGCLGYNFKSSEVNAAFGLSQLNKYPKFFEKRRCLFNRYIENLKNVKEIILPDDSMEPNWLAFPIQYEDRLELIKYLESKNIQTRVIFSGNITRHPAYREFLQPFKSADTIMKNGILLGCHHGMVIENVDYVCNTIKEYINSKNA